MILPTPETPSPIGRSQFYRTAAANLGVAALAKRQIAKRFGSAPLMKLTARESEHPLFARRGTSDLSVFDQIFSLREYRCLDHLQGVQTIVDAGANVGYSSAWLLTRFPQARVVAIEPDRANFAVAARNLAPYGARASLFNGALWWEDSTLSFDSDYGDEGDEWSRRVTAAEDAKGDVEAISVTTLMDRWNMPSIDILKIDIEGAEEAVFGAKDLSWLDRVRALVIELHGPSCEAALAKAMEGRRFDISCCDELIVCLPEGR